jgi:hypothetical protein
MLAENLLLGLTVGEWVVLIPAIAAAITAIVKALREKKKVRAVVDSVEEVAEEFPEAADILRRLVEKKTQRLGVGASMHKDVLKVRAVRKEADTKRAPRPTEEPSE